MNDFTGMTFDQYRMLNQQQQAFQKSLLGQQQQAMLDQNKLAFNVPTLSLGLQGLGSLAGIYYANKGLQQAKDQFNFQKDVTNTNLNNQIKSYNTALNDRINARAAQQGNMTAQQVADYKKFNQLTR